MTAKRQGIMSIVFPDSSKGRAGEEFAARTLEKLGYRILARNVHSPYGEIDLVAQRDDVICFVEVKTRREGAMVSGAQAVGKVKQIRIIKTALVYLQEHPSGLQPRFDVFSVVTRGGKAAGYDYITGAFDSEAYSKSGG